jgi:hypothetical protein
VRLRENKGGVIRIRIEDVEDVDVDVREEGH